MSADSMDAQFSRLQRGIDNVLSERRRLIATLETALEFFDDRADVSDGDDGAQVPNDAARMAHDIRETLRAVRASAAVAV